MGEPYFAALILSMIKVMGNITLFWRLGFEDEVMNLPEYIFSISPDSRIGSRPSVPMGHSAISVISLPPASQKTVPWD